MWEECSACGRSVGHVGGVWCMWEECGACGRSVVHVGGV